MFKLVKFATAVLCLFFSTNFAFAETPPPTDPPEIVLGNWENSMGVGTIGPCITLIPDYQLVVHVLTRVSDNNLSLYPTMFIEYNIGGLIQGYDQVTSAELNAVTINGKNVYEHDFLSVIDMGDECNEKGLGTAPIPVSFTYTLVTRIRGVYVPYPITEHPSLFPPETFQEAAVPGFIPTYSGTKGVCCPSLFGKVTKEQESASVENTIADVSTSSGSQTGNSLTDTFVKSIKEASLTKDFEVFPNPFKDAIQVRFDLDSPSEVSYQLFDSQGRQLLNVRENYEQKGTYNKKFNNLNLPAGIYYMQLYKNGATQSVKIVKFE